MPKKETAIKNPSRSFEGTTRGQLNLINHTQHFEGVVVYPETSKKRKYIKEAKVIRSYSPADFMRSIIVAFQNCIFDKREGVNDDLKMYYGDDIIISVFTDDKRPSISYFRKARMPATEALAIDYAEQVIKDWFLSCYGIKCGFTVFANEFYVIFPRTPEGYMKDSGRISYLFAYNTTTDLPHKICSCIKRESDSPLGPGVELEYPEMDAFLGAPKEQKFVALDDEEEESEE